MVPQTSNNILSKAFAVSQVCLLKEWIYIFECKNQCHCSLWDFAGIKNCVQSSPSATVLTEWVTNLAQVNLLEEMEQIDQCGGLVHLQSNGGPSRQDIKVFNVFDLSDVRKDAPNGSIHQFWALCVGGKSRQDSAHSLVNCLKTVCVVANKPTVHGLTVDSGGGTPESLKAELAVLELMYEANLFC